MLREGEKTLPLTPKPFETLVYLASRSGRVVSKTELMEKLWPATFVTEDVLVQCVVDIRRVLGDSAKHPHYIQTVPRRGYQFLAEVRRNETPVVGEARRPEPAEPSAPAVVDPPPEPVLTPSFPPVPPAPVRRRPGLAVLAGVALLLLVALAGLAVRRTRPAPERTATVPGSLLVLPIEVEDAASESRWLHHGLSEILGAVLGQRPGVHIVARHRLATALTEAGLPDEARLGPREALEVAGRLGAERLVSGSFLRVRDEFVLNAQMVDVATGQADGMATVRGRYPDDLLSSVDQVALRLAERWEALPDTAWRPVRLATRSVDAYRQYSEALEWFARGGQRGAEEAERRLDEALRLDSGFAFAYLRKAEIQQWRRRWGYGDPDPRPALEAARRLARDLPEREALLVEMMHQQIVRGDIDAARQAGESILRSYPAFADEMGVPAALGEMFYLRGRWDDLITVGRGHVDAASMPASERARLAAYLSLAYRHKGEFETALVQARKAVKLWPTRDGPSFLHLRSDLGRTALDAGRREEALRELRAIGLAAEADASNLTDAGWGVYMAGEPAEAAALADRALALDPAYGNAHHLRGWLHLRERRFAEAAASFESAFERTPTSFGMTHLGFVGGRDVAALYYAGVAWKLAGDAPRSEKALRRALVICQEAAAGPESPQVWEARSLLAITAARLGESAPEPPRLPGDDATFFLQSARLHAVQGRKDQALRELGLAMGLTAGERQHVRDDPNFEALRGDPEFERLTAAQPGARSN